ncbi:hypothetical protein C8R44DRAFT_942398 [Mycena epipterygia]|nr:hypothetical protein C8R44DRAFT_942398 [Mycena epipterygia]
MPDSETVPKIWSIYVGEAEKYDRALVEDWRSNMDSILTCVRPNLLLPAI